MLFFVWCGGAANLMELIVTDAHHSPTPTPYQKRLQYTFWQKFYDISLIRRHVLVGGAPYCRKSLNKKQTSTQSMQ